jgi:hypothetical protein
MDSTESRTRQAAIDFETCLDGIAPDVDPEEALDEEFLAEARGFIRRMLDRGKLENADDWRETLATMGSVEEFRRHWGGGDQDEDNPAGRERRVRAAYQASAGDAEVISLYDLRRHPELEGMPHELVDAALRAMARRPDVHLIAEDNLPALTDDERDAAVEIGGEPKHLIAIDGASQVSQCAENAADEPPPYWRDHSDDEDPATGWTQLEVAESKWAGRTGKCCYVIADVGFDGPRQLCGHRVALGWIYCSDHLEDISYGDPKTVDPERFRVGQF